MKEIIVAVLSLATALAGAKWFSPELIDWDALLPAAENIRIKNDFVYVHVNSFQHKAQNPNVSEEYEGDKVYDNSTYVEQLILRKTSGIYKIRLVSSGIAPQIMAIEPAVASPVRTTADDGRKIIEAELDTHQSHDPQSTGTLPNPKMIYIFRNSFQNNRSFAGKNIAYQTDTINFVIDFSNIDWLNLIDGRPYACLKVKNDENPRKLKLEWENGIATVHVHDLNPDDKLRVFWTWKGSDIRLDCKSALE